MNPSTAPEFESWSVPQIPLMIEYAPHVLEEIRVAATDELRQLSRGGIETGGVLFGTRGASSIRITSWRPIACEHARGPAFLLSHNDRMALDRLLQNQKQEVALAGLHPLGWFVSHTRSSVGMLESDLKMYEHYFPWSWQTTLVLHPTREGPAEAGFFVRDANGNLKSDTSYRTFTIRPAVRTQVVRPPVTGLESPSERDEPTEPPSRPQSFVRPETDSPIEAEPLPGAALALSARHSALTGRRAWIWAVPVLLAIIALASMWEPKAPTPRTPTFAFRANDNGGELRLEWDKNSEPIRNAARGDIEIKDSDAPLMIALDTERLRRGAFVYPRKSGDLELRMTVYPVTGPPLQEFAKFVGGPVTLPTARASGPAAPVIIDDPTQLRRERNQLRTEVEQLRGSLQKATARNRELEGVVRILENRVQVQKLLPPPANK
jgi:hypothetical protein